MLLVSDRLWYVKMVWYNVCNTVPEHAKHLWFKISLLV